MLIKDDKKIFKINNGDEKIIIHKIGDTKILCLIMINNFFNGNK
jgi:hypothetical protein